MNGKERMKNKEKKKRMKKTWFSYRMTDWSRLLTICLFSKEVWVTEVLTKYTYNKITSKNSKNK